jgi:hypothetical protein
MQRSGPRPGPTRIPAAIDAEALALRALAFLAGDEDQFSRFVALTGVGEQEMRARAGDPDFLAGVLDHVLGDEALLMRFIASEGIDPGLPAAARRRLPGATLDH